MDGHKEGHVKERSNPRRDKPGHQHHGKSTNQKYGRRRQSGLVKRRVVDRKTLILQASDNPGINDHSNQNRRQERKPAYCQYGSNTGHLQHRSHRDKVRRRPKTRKEFFCRRILMPVNISRRKVSVSEQSIKGTGDFRTDAVNDRRQRLKHRTDLLTCVFQVELRQVLKRRGII